MSDRLVTDREIEGLLRRLRKLEDRLDRGMPEVPLYTPPTAYTPTYVGATTPGVTTYSFQQGEYVRIGRLVVASGAVVWTAATGTGNARISLPIAGAAGLNQSGSVRVVSVTFAAGAPQVEFAGSPYFEMRSPATNAAGTVVAVEAAGNIVFTIVYLID